LDIKVLSEKGYIHETVNHSKNFVDPETGVNTQRIKSLWKPLRLKIVKKMCGTNEDIRVHMMGGKDQQWSNSFSNIEFNCS